MKAACCARKSRRSPFFLGALALLLPKCPACVPGFILLFSALGLQFTVAESALFAVKCMAGVLALYALAKR